MDNHLNLNLVYLTFNTAFHESTGLTPFEMTFGRKVNLPSALSTTSSLTYQEILDMWKKRHEDYLKKGRAALRGAIYYMSWAKIVTKFCAWIEKKVFTLGTPNFAHT